MEMSRGRAMLLCAIVFALMTLEQILFGRDTPGAAHDISVVAWVVSLVAAATFVLLVVTAGVSRVRSRRLDA